MKGKGVMKPGSNIPAGEELPQGVPFGCMYCIEMVDMSYISILTGKYKGKSGKEFIVPFCRIPSSVVPL